MGSGAADRPPPDHYICHWMPDTGAEYDHSGNILLEGLLLDPVYTGRIMAGAIDLPLA